MTNEHKHRWVLLRDVNPKNPKLHFKCAHGMHYVSYNREKLRNFLKN